MSKYTSLLVRAAIQLLLWSQWMIAPACSAEPITIEHRIAAAAAGRMLAADEQLQACKVDSDCTGSTPVCARENLRSKSPLVCCASSVDLGTGNIICGAQPGGLFCPLFEGDSLCASGECDGGICTGPLAPGQTVYGKFDMDGLE